MPESNNDSEENENDNWKKWQIISLIMISSITFSGLALGGGIYWGYKMYQNDEYNNDWIIYSSLYYVEVSYINGSHYSTLEYNRNWMDQPDLLYLEFWDNDPNDKKNPECFDLYIGNDTFAYQLVNVSIAFSKYRTLRFNLKFELYSYDYNPITDIISNPQYIYGDKNVSSGKFTLEELNLTFIEYRIML